MCLLWSLADSTFMIRLSIFSFVVSALLHSPQQVLHRNAFFLSTRLGWTYDISVRHHAFFLDFLDWDCAIGLSTRLAFASLRIVLCNIRCPTFFLKTSIQSRLSSFRFAHASEKGMLPVLGFLYLDSPCTIALPNWSSIISICFLCISTDSDYWAVE